jgi:LuxR family quorum sensing-dependent transcriptional regulator
MFDHIAADLPGDIVSIPRHHTKLIFGRGPGRVALIIRQRYLITEMSSRYLASANPEPASRAGCLPADRSTSSLHRRTPTKSVGWTMIEIQALKFIDTINRHQTTGCVLKAMGSVLKNVGIDFLCMNLLTSPKQDFFEVLLASRLPLEWLSTYTSKHFADYDPSQRHVKRVVHPYEWKDAPYDPDREPRVLEVVRCACDFGIGNGFVVPIPGSAGNVGNVWMGGYHYQLPDRYKPLLHLMALYAFAHIQRLSEPTRKSTSLSCREREILTWIAAGKSVVEIGEILNISDRTVEWHIQNSIAKLHAKTRTNAVAIALREGLVAF